MKTNNAIVKMKLSENTLERLDSLSKSLDKPRVSLVQDAIEEFVEKHEA